MAGGYSRAPAALQRWDANDWLRHLMECGVRAVTAAAGWAEGYAHEVQPDRFSAGMADLVPFVATFLHETAMCERLLEDMNYSAQRIREVWPSRFPTLDAASEYAYSPQKLANAVYGGRMGNTAPDDGWNFRGRAAGITGRRNYEWLGDKWGQDLTVSPQILEQPVFALHGSILVWEGLVPDRSLSDQVQCRKSYNGALIGMEHCSQLQRVVARVLA